MKTIRNFIITSLLVFPFGFASAEPPDEATAKVIFDKAYPVGTIITSILPPTQFRIVASDSWVPADGRKINPSSKYTLLTSLETVPDLRGMFLRGLNAFETSAPRTDGKQDPDGSGRKVGDFQPDTVARHDHGRGMANWPDSGVGGNVRPNGGRDQHPDHWNPRYVPPVSYGGLETRPKNVSIYYYIKIN